MIEILHFSKQINSKLSFKCIAVVKRERMNNFYSQNTFLSFSSTIQKIRNSSQMSFLVINFVKKQSFSLFYLFQSFLKKCLSSSVFCHNFIKKHLFLSLASLFLRKQGRKLKKTSLKGAKTINKNILQIAFRVLQLEKSKNKLQNEFANMIKEENNLQREKTSVQRTNENLFSKGLISQRIFSKWFTKTVIFPLQDVIFFTLYFNRNLFINL